jgi:hypothetical protein
MKKYIIILGLVLVSLSYAQTDSTQPTPSSWKHSLVSGLTATQVSFSDWAQGGENALSYTVVIDGKSEQDLPLTKWTNTYKLAYGQTELGSKGLRKTDDKIEFESVLSYKVGVYVNPYASVTLKTQFDVGYNYDDAAGTKTVLSRFWAPAYLTQSIGLGYQPIQQVKTRLGVALREVASKTGYIENNRTEGGIESVTDAEFKFEENLLLNTKLELFAPFNKFDVVVIRSNNTLTAKVSKYISVNLNVQIINDANIQARSQIKESLAMGLSYTLL